MKDLPLNDFQDEAFCAAATPSHSSRSDTRTEQARPFLIASGREERAQRKRPAPETALWTDNAASQEAKKAALNVMEKSLSRRNGFVVLVFKPCPADEDDELEGR